MTLLEFFDEYHASLLLSLAQHLRLVGMAIVIATLIGFPLSVLLANRQRAARPVLAILNGIQTVPSIALFALMIPLLVVVNRSVGELPATIALVLYALLPVVRSSYDALRSVSPDVIESARGQGMDERAIVRFITVPLALPGILSGIRLATTGGIGVAAVAAYIGAGGLGEFIQRGINTSWSTMIVGGVVAIIVVTLVSEIVLSLFERLVTPRGIRLMQRRRQ